jgi:HSP20 family molecular chaperone IbpA
MLSETLHNLTADVIFEDDTIRIELEVPGLEYTRLDIRARDHTVAISGHRPIGRGGHYLLMERGRDFRREFHLPHETDMRNLHARVHDGVLTISAPYGTGHAAPTDKRIEVQPSICACHSDAAAC